MRRRVLLILACLLAGCGDDARRATMPATTASAPARTPATPRVDTVAAVRRLAGEGRPVFCGAQRGNMVALTFDDGPGPYTHFVLKRLRRNHMRATFFLTTKNFDRFARWVPRELRYGAVGDHIRRKGLRAVTVPEMMASYPPTPAHRAEGLHGTR